MAKPVIDVLFPHLASIEQPLAGETAAPRWVLESCGLADGYAVELALLIDVAARYGVETIAQVDLGVRVHPESSALGAAPPGHRHPAGGLGPCPADHSGLRGRPGPGNL